MEQDTVSLEEAVEFVQDKEAIIELPHDVLDRIGGGTIVLTL